MALNNVTSHFSTMLETIASASFLSSLSIIHGFVECVFFISVAVKKNAWRQGPFVHLVLLKLTVPGL